MKKLLFLLSFFLVSSAFGLEVIFNGIKQGGGSGDGGIKDLIEDTTPQLGGTLDLRGQTVTNAFEIWGDGTNSLVIDSDGQDIEIGEQASSGADLILFPTTTFDAGLLVDNGVLDLDGNVATNGTFNGTLIGNALGATNLNASNITTGILNTNRYNALTDLNGGAGNTVLRRDGSWTNVTTTDALADVLARGVDANGLVITNHGAAVNPGDVVNKATLDAAVATPPTNTAVFGSLYIHDGSVTQVVPNAVYTQLTGWTTGEVAGLTLTTSNITILADGTYSILQFICSEVDANNESLEGAIHVNGVHVDEGEWSRDMTINILGSASGGALLDLSAGDVVTVGVKNEGIGTANMHIHQAQLLVSLEASVTSGTNWAPFPALVNVNMGGNSITNFRYHIVDVATNDYTLTLAQSGWRFYFTNAATITFPSIDGTTRGLNYIFSTPPNPGFSLTFHTPDLDTIDDVGTNDYVSASANSNTLYEFVQWTPTAWKIEKGRGNND